MKRIFAFVLSLTVCIAVFGVFSVGADDSIEYIFYENFDNLSYVPQQKYLAGMKACNGYMASTSINDGRFECVNDADRQAFVDIQLWNSDIKKLTGDFTLYFEMKLLGDWMHVDQQLLRFSYNNPDTNETASEKHSFVQWQRSAIAMTTDYGVVFSDALNTREYVAVEFVFHEIRGTYTCLECYVNGELLGEKTLNDKNLTAIDHFRMFMSYKNNSGVSIESFAIAKGTRSIYGARIPDSAERQVRTVHKLSDDPSEFLRSDLENYYYNDFNVTLDQINTESKKISDTDCFWLSTSANSSSSGETAYWGITDEGSLRVSGADFIDMQFLKDSVFDVREDFVLSMKIKLIGACHTGLIIEGIRGYEGIDTWDTTGRVELKEGHIYLGGKECGIFPMNEWVYIDLSYDYDDEAEEFVSFKLMLNGELFGEGSCDTRVDLTRIRQFRLFRSFDTNEVYEIDELSLHKGNESVIHLHNWSEGVIASPATHISDGLKTYTCADCGAVESEKIFKIKDHTFSNWTSNGELDHTRACECGLTEEMHHQYLDGESDVSCNYCGFEQFVEIIEQEQGCGAVASVAFIPFCCAAAIVVLHRRKKEQRSRNLFFESILLLKKRRAR